MQNRWFTILALLPAVVVLAVTGLAHAAPEPALVPEPDTWQLDLELHGNPQQIYIRLPGDSEGRRFWYLLYTITNNTGRDIEFYPQFDLYTDTFKLVHAGVRVPRAVFEAIQKRYDKTIPLLEPENMVTGRILIGQDNARDSVAIFQEFDPNATGARIFIAGLSNETVTVTMPTPSNTTPAIENAADQSETGQNTVGPDNIRQDKTEKNTLGRNVLLRKTLMLEYQVPGDNLNPGEKVMLYRRRNWIMR